MYEECHPKHPLSTKRTHISSNTLSAYSLRNSWSHVSHALREVDQLLKEIKFCVVKCTKAFGECNHRNAISMRKM